MAVDEVVFVVGDGAGAGGLAVVGEGGGGGGAGGGVTCGGGGGGGGRRREEEGADHGDARGEVEWEELPFVEELIGGAQNSGGFAG